MELQRRVLIGREPGPHLLITGGVHGDEFEPMLAIRRLMTVPELEPSRLRGRVTLVPVVNEAAYLRGHRTADDGLDLARTCPGRPEGSITERTAHALSELIRSADAYIDLHTGGTRLRVHPLSGYVLHPNETVREQSRRMAWAFNLPVVWATDYRLEGRSMSVARDANVPAIYCEWHGAAVCEPEGVEAYVAGCLNVLGLLGMIERTPPTSQVRHAIEDPRPGSGHMQVCNPSPRTGYFQPTVKLGDIVQTGALIGTVSDVLGEETVAVTAQNGGIVLVLTTFPSVRQGDALAVIAEMG